MKLVTRENGEFPMSSEGALSFTLYPDHPMADVRLNITLDKLLFLIQSLDWTIIPS